METIAGIPVFELTDRAIKKQFFFQSYFKLKLKFLKCLSTIGRIPIIELTDCAIGGNHDGTFIYYIQLMQL